MNESNVFETVCPHCESEMEYRKIFRVKDNETDTHIWNCTECPNVLFEFMDSDSLHLLAGYLNKSEEVIETIYFSTYEYENLNHEKVDAVPFNVKWLEKYFEQEGSTLEDFQNNYTFDEISEMRKAYLFQMEDEMAEGSSVSFNLYKEIKPI